MSDTLPSTCSFICRGPKSIERSTKLLARSTPAGQRWRRASKETWDSNFSHIHGACNTALVKPTVNHYRIRAVLLVVLPVSQADTGPS